MPVLKGKVKVKDWPAGSGPVKAFESVIVVLVTSITVVPGATRPEAIVSDCHSSSDSGA